MRNHAQVYSSKYRYILASSIRTKGYFLTRNYFRAFKATKGNIIMEKYCLMNKLDRVMMCRDGFLFVHLEKATEETT